MDTPTLQRLAPPAVTALVAFLAYSSQWLFSHIDPGALRKGDSYIFNALVASLLISYWRTCFTDPGRIPKDWHERPTVQNDSQTSQRQRWCRKCDAPKPPRAHHCKTCKRCIVKMDHHCIWTANCISTITFPHFLRFLLYAVASMTHLQLLLYHRCAELWTHRDLPSYLGPSIPQLTHLFILVSTNSLILFALILLLCRTLWSTALNTTTIETWEIDRHHVLLRRARVFGGFLPGPDGTQLRIEHQEFPWDVGIWTNAVQAMGTANVLAWAWPLARSPRVEDGLAFPHNGIEDESLPWPPPDPDRLFRVPRRDVQAGSGFTRSWDVRSFRERQRVDLARYADADAEGEEVVRRRPFHERLEEMQRETEGSEASGSGAEEKRGGGEEAWRNGEGERLADFGVDEVADFYDEDDVPLAEILRRRRAEG